jgi:hypothetical protein
VDLEGRVLDGDDRPIPGLWGAGELTGFGGVNGWAGLEGTFLGPSILTGRTTARAVLAALATERRLQPRREPPPPPPVPAASGAADACLECHPVPDDVERSRPGYLHFEAVHRAVLSEERSCASCHAELAPFDPDRHAIDRIALAGTCGSCHLAREH